MFVGPVFGIALLYLVFVIQFGCFCLVGFREFAIDVVHKDLLCRLSLSTIGTLLDQAWTAARIVGIERAVRTVICHRSAIQHSIQWWFLFFLPRKG